MKQATDRYDAPDAGQPPAGTDSRPVQFFRALLEGFDSAGGGWGNRILALAILAVLAAAIAQHELTRWILVATGAGMLVTAAVAGVWRRAHLNRPGSNAQDR